MLNVYWLVWYKEMGKTHGNGNIHVIIFSGAGQDLGMFLTDKFYIII